MHTADRVVQGLRLCVLGCGFNNHSVDQYFVPLCG